MTSDQRCAKCDQPMDTGARFCGSCGTPASPANDRESDLRTASLAARSECPACGHVNNGDARFCDRCGTQLRQIASPQDTGASGESRVDPWMAGPGYQRKLGEARLCPRCGSFRSNDDRACLTCGLPFDDLTTSKGVPAAVAARGNPAGFWIRLLALFIDGVIITTAGTVLWQVLFGESLWITEMIEFADGSTREYRTVNNWIYVIQFLYHTTFIALFGATPGKRVLNIRVYDAEGKTGIGFTRAGIRALGMFLSSLTLGFGYVMAAFRKDKRALHDLIAGTYPTRPKSR